MSHVQSNDTDPNAMGSLFYRVDLFENDQLTDIEFFEPNQLKEAKERAASAVSNGNAHRAEVRDDAAGLVAEYSQ